MRPRPLPAHAGRTPPEASPSLLATCPSALRRALGRASRDQVLMGGSDPWSTPPDAGIQGPTRPHACCSLAAHLRWITSADRRRNVADGAVGVRALHEQRYRASPSEFSKVQGTAPGPYGSEDETPTAWRGDADAPGTGTHRETQTMRDDDLLSVQLQRFAPGPNEPRPQRPEARHGDEPCSFDRAVEHIDSEYVAGVGPGHHERPGHLVGHFPPSLIDGLPSGQSLVRFVAGRELHGRTRGSVPQQLRARRPQATGTPACCTPAPSRWHSSFHRTRPPRSAEKLHFLQCAADTGAGSWRDALSSSELLGTSTMASRRS